MSLSLEDSSFTLSSKTESQRKSTFYLTDPINIDLSDDITEPQREINTLGSIPEQKTNTTLETAPSITRNLKKTKLTRPSYPPPPVPTLLGKYLLLYSVLLFIVNC